MNPLKDYIDHQREYNKQLLNHNMVTVKRLGNIDRIVYCRTTKGKGSISYITKNSVNEVKLKNNLVRAKSSIREYALCNEWKYFVTLTIDKTKFDRYNLSAYKKSLGKFINNWNNRHEQKVTYLLVPEFHQDGAVHMHGLINGLDDVLVKNEYGYLDWQEYHNKFGYISLDKIRDNIKVAHYITKYITKELASHSEEMGKHLYIHSNGLKRGEVIYREKAEITVFDYENYYCKIKEIDNTKESYSWYIDQ